MSRRGVTEEPLRVLVVGAGWPLETFLDRLFLGLAERGVEVRIAHRSVATDPYASLRLAGSRGPAAWRAAQKVWRAGAGGLRSPRRALHLLRQTDASSPVRDLLRGWPLFQRPWDVVYFPWNAAAVRHLPLLRTGLPSLVSCRGAQIQVAPHDPARATLRAGLPESLRRATGVHCVSRAILREATGFGLDPAKARVIHPAVNPQAFAPAEDDEPARGVDTGSFRVLTTASLIWRKGFETSLLAIRRLVDAGVDVRYEIVGDGPERQRILFTVHDLGLDDRVTLHGRQPPEFVRARLHVSDAFLLTSSSEGVSNAVLEAMASAVPVVTTDCGGMEEAVRDGVDGFVVRTLDPATPDEAARALRRLASEPSLRREMGAAARRRVEEEFSLVGQVEHFHELLGACADERVTAPRSL